MVTLAAELAEWKDYFEVEEQYRDAVICPVCGERFPRQAPCDRHVELHHSE